jgi:hypothetical protein
MILEITRAGLWYKLLVQNANIGVPDGRFTKVFSGSTRIWV